MDRDEFEPRLGRMRSAASPRGRKYLHAVLAAAARAGMPKRTPGLRFSGSRIGRGGVAARFLGRHPGLRSRRAIVKTRLVRLGGKAVGTARAHLRYIQRDGVSREGEPGRLYSASDDQADGKAFLERSSGDRHQFRLIVSAEDGAQYDDLRPLIRRFMARMEEDLGTRLDWVAADHVDTLHPHTHIMLRGRAEDGANLVIAPDYIKRGMRERLAGLVSLDLGPRTDVEIERGRRLEVHAERLTSIDRRLLREADPSGSVLPIGRNMADHALQTGRLRKLASLGLAEDRGGGRWRLGPDVEAALRQLGERGDIIRTLQRALKRNTVERAVAEQAIFDPGAGSSVTGRIVARGLADELRDRHYLIVDGIDGRSHYVDVGRGDAVEPLGDDAIVRIMPRIAANEAMDRTIAEIAAGNDGRYSVELHVAGGSASESFAQSHVRRLEAIRRKVGGPERSDDGSWSIPADFMARARRYEAARVRDAPVEIEVLSPIPLKDLIAQDGATWLDRELVGPPSAVREAGFGREVRSALALRRSWLLEQGFRIEPGLVAGLQQRELARTAARLARETGLDFAALLPGAAIEGIVRRRLDLASGRFAMIDNEREFALVPWRPVLAGAIDQRVAGRVRANGGISWSIGRGRTLDV